MRDIINKKLNKLEDLELELSQLEVQRKLAVAKVEKSAKALEIMQKAAKLSQEQLAAHLSEIVTQAIQAVIQKPYEFVCEFVERRGSTEADLYLAKDGHRFGILGGTGGGLADVCSFSLKIAYLLLSNVDRVLVIDEVARHINSPKQKEAFAEVLSRLSKEFGIQLIINSTVPELLAVADNVITLGMVNNQTKVISNG